MNSLGIVQCCLVVCVIGLVYSMFDFSNRIEIFLASWLAIAIFGAIWVVIWSTHHFLNLRKKRINSRRS